VSTEQNKAVVRRWMTEILEGGHLDAIDEVLAPDYVNPAMGNADRDGMRAILAQLKDMGPWRIPSVEILAEGDAVVARFVLEITRPGGEKVTANGLTYYRLANGKIVADDPFTRPDLAQVLGLTPPAA
jgi:predicted SnoaL-like aldol condensation-catalyzing enzyme